MIDGIVNVGCEWMSELNCLWLDWARCKDTLSVIGLWDLGCRLGDFGHRVSQKMLASAC